MKDRQLQKCQQELEVWLLKVYTLCTGTRICYTHSATVVGLQLYAPLEAIRTDDDDLWVWIVILMMVNQTVFRTF